MTATASDGALLAYAVTAPDDTRTALDALDAIVLVHGITESRGAWAPVVERLAARHRVIAVDLRGHGASQRLAPYDAFTMAADLDTVLRALGEDNALVVGHSLGGVVVSAYAAAGYPARGIVNVDQSLALGGFKEILTMLEPALRGTPEEFATAMQQVFSVLDGPLPASERARLNTVSSPEQDVVLGVWDIVLSSSNSDLEATVESLAGAMRLPYLSLHGADPGTEYADWLTRLVPTATVEIWADQGHYPHLLDPDRFVTRLEALD